MFTLPDTAESVILSLKAAGYEAYAVGGSVRDMLMKRETHGWDFTTNATPEEILKIFPDSFYDNQFGTVGIKIRDQAGGTVDIYEVTTYRSEEGYSDFRHPDKLMWGHSLEKDLSRRDFTINAIAFDGAAFIDPYDGRGDLERKVIRTVGDPEARFAEDALRMMRAIRIAAQLGFQIHDDTAKAITKHAQLITSISRERIRDELMKLLASEYPGDGMLILHNTSLLSYILPELDACFGVEQKSPQRHHIYDVGNHLIRALDFCPSPDPLVRLATLLHDIGKAKTSRVTKDGVITFYNHEVVGARMLKEISARLRLSKKQAERLYTLVRWHQFSVDERQTDSAIRRFIRRVGKDNLEDILAVRIGDRLGGGARETSWRLELFKKRLEDVQKQPFSVPDLKVNGHDVMSVFALPPGPAIGLILDKVFTAVVAGKLTNEREAQMTFLKEMKESGDIPQNASRV